MTGNNPNVDIVSINANAKFDEILSIGSQEIWRKRNFDGLMENKASIAPTFSKMHDYSRVYKIW